MSAPRFYIDHPLAPGARFSLPPGPARHAARALRLAAGDAVTLFNGQGGEHEAHIERIQKDEVAVSIGSFVNIERESHLRVMLVQGISSGERMDYTLQKAVELGVMAIQPIAAKRSVVKLAGERADRRVAHWQGVVTSACEQCGRNQIPAVAAPLTLANWLGHTTPQGLQPVVDRSPLGHTTPQGLQPVVDRSPLGHTAPQGLLPKDAREPIVGRGASGQHVSGRLLFLSPLADSRLVDLPAPTAMDSLVAGPEGGFEADEIAALLAAGAIPVRLGPRVLRTETAALAALATMQTLWGDF